MLLEDNNDFHFRIYTAITRFYSCLISGGLNDRDSPHAVKNGINPRQVVKVDNRTSKLCWANASGDRGTSSAHFDIDGAGKG